MRWSSNNEVTGLMEDEDQIVSLVGGTADPTFPK